MKGRKGLAFILAAALTFGCAVTSYADGATSSTGIGNDTGHLDTNITTSVMPTDNSVADIFSYYADPERLVQAAGDKLNNTTTGSSVTANNYGIYFNETNTQTSTNAVITLKNYADVNVTVKATVVTAGTMSLTTNSAINTVTDGAAQVYLALNLKQGSTTTSATIQAAGTTKSLKVAGQTTKFDTVITDGAYVLQEKDAQTWDTVEINLNGAVSQAIITDSDAAPNVKLEWSVTAANAEETVTPTNMAACSAMNGSAFIRLVSGQNAVANKITSVKIDGTPTTNYSVTQSGAIQVDSVPSGNHTILIVYDGVTYQGTVQ